MRKLLILFVLPLQQVLAQGFDTAALDRYFDVLDSNSRFMGTVAVLRDGRPLYGPWAKRTWWRVSRRRRPPATEWDR
jgi:hypothetical protein